VPIPYYAQSTCQCILVEAGLAGFDSGNWIGLLAPAGTPKAVIALLNGDLNLVLQVQEVRETLPDHDFEPMGGTPEHFGAYVRAEVAKWARVTQAAGLKSD
jgi:tripartite-type tricarboxylate transporter receptor subunit TctC